MKIKHTLIAAAVLSSASFSAFAAVEYSITDLGTIYNGDRSIAYGISENGLIVGNSRGRVPTGAGSDARSSTLGARFYNDATKYVANIGGLGYSGGHGSTVANSVNNNGLAAGYSPVFDLSGSRKYQAFVHHNKTGYMQNIGTLGNGAESRANGINNHGQVVGWSNTKADGSDNVAFIYDASTNVMSEIQGLTLGGSRSFAFDINDKGNIVGTATTANGSANAFLYNSTDQSTTNLGSLDNSGFSEARAINEDGDVVGFSLDSNNLYTAFFYDSGSQSMQSLGSMGGDSTAYDVNASNVVVGQARDANNVRHAFVAKNGQMQDLYSLLSPADQAMWKDLSGAFGINDDGKIVGYGNFWTDKDNGRSQRMAFSLTTVPVPAAIFFMGPALGLLGFMGKKRSQTVA